MYIRAELYLEISLLQFLNSYKMFKLVLVCAFAFVLNGAIASTKKPVPQKTVMDNLLEEISTIRKDVESSIMSIMPDTQNITKFVIDSSKDFADAVEKSSKVIRLQAKNVEGVVDNAIKEFTSKLVYSANKLKDVTENTMQQANQVVTAIEIQVRGIFDDVQSAIQTNLLSSESKLKIAAGKFFNDVITAGKRFQLDLTSCKQK